MDTNITENTVIQPVLQPAVNIPPTLQSSQVHTNKPKLSILMFCLIIFLLLSITTGLVISGYLHKQSKETLITVKSAPTPSTATNQSWKTYTSVPFQPDGSSNVYTYTISYPAKYELGKNSSAMIPNVSFIPLDVTEGGKAKLTYISSTIKFTLLPTPMILPTAGSNMRPLQQTFQHNIGKYHATLESLDQEGATIRSVSIPFPEGVGYIRIDFIGRTDVGDTFDQSLEKFTYTKVLNTPLQILTSKTVTSDVDVQFQKANDTKRRTDIFAIFNGLNQYTLDSSGSLPHSTHSETPIASTGFDACRYLVPHYLAALPTDPLLNNGASISDCSSPYDTGYTISFNSSDNVVTLRAARAQLSEIVITKTLQHF